ncbi:MAG: hypothetical protein GX589_11240, partial [Deltaproteobacteria bacterium]|nr:hypothetical protein [Deltaproteobacteria bacterium]
FIVGANDVTLDLNNHTVTFGALPFTGVPNHDFEIGKSDNPAQPVDWDLSAAASAKRVCESGMELVGDCLLFFNKPATTETILSGWVNIQAVNRTYIASVMVKSCWGCMHRMEVEQEHVGVIAQTSSSNVERAPMLYAQFKPQTSARYRLKITFEDPAGRESWIDFADIQPAYDAGIVMRGYFDNYRTPDLVGKGGKWTNFTVKNGSIIEGNRGTKFRAVSKGSTNKGRFEMDRVTTRVSGIDASNFWVEYDGNNVLHDSTFINTVPAVINRMSLDNFPINIGSDSEIYNCTIDGGQGGISASGQSNVVIRNNTIKIRATATNHYSVTTYKSDNIIVRDNHIQSYQGPGVLFSINTTNSEIANNTFIINPMPFSPEYHSGLTTPAIRVSDYNVSDVSMYTENNRIYNNTISGTVRSSPKFPSSTSSIVGFHLSTSGVNEYYDNTVRIKTEDDKAEAIAIYGAASNTGTFRNNFLESNHRLAWLANSYAADGNGRYISNTFSKGPNPINYGGLVVGYCCGISSENNIFLDNKFINGASMAYSLNSNHNNAGDHYSYTLKWYLDITVVNRNNKPIVGAEVTATATGGGTETLRGRSDNQGRVRLELSEYSREGSSYRVRPTANDTPYTPHAVTASYGSLTTSQNITMNANQAITMVLDTDSVAPSAPSMLRLKK